jgi:hypothetical protein
MWVITIIMKTLEKSESKALKALEGGNIVDKPKASVKRMSISLTGQSADVLDHLATSQQITQNEALRKAIGTEAYIQAELSNGSSFRVIKPDGREVEIVFR